MPFPSRTGKIFRIIQNLRLSLPGRPRFAVSGQNESAVFSPSKSEGPGRRVLFSAGIKEWHMSGPTLETGSATEVKQWIDMYRRMLAIRMFEEHVNDLYT